MNENVYNCIFCEHPLRLTEYLYFNFDGHTPDERYEYVCTNCGSTVTRTIDAQRS